MEKYKQTNFTSITDFLFIMLFGIIILFFNSIPKKPVENNPIERQVEYMITIEWDKMLADDVDLFLYTADGQGLSFKNKEVGVYNLERDDMGESTDIVTDINGNASIARINEETITFRGWTSGRYTFSVFMYTMTSKHPVEVRIKAYRMNPFDIFIDRTVTLTRDGEEITGGTFTLDQKGNIQDLNFDESDIRFLVGVVG